MSGRGLQAPARPNTLNICTLIVFHCLGRSERGHSQAFKIPPSPSNGSLTFIKKLVMHFIIWASSLSLSLSQPTCLFSSCLTWETHWEVFDGNPEFRKKVLLYCFFFFFFLSSSTLKSLAYVQQATEWGLGGIYAVCQMEISLQIGWNWLITPVQKEERDGKEKLVFFHLWIIRILDKTGPQSIAHMCKCKARRGSSNTHTQAFLITSALWKQWKLSAAQALNHKYLNNKWFNLFTSFLVPLSCSAGFEIKSHQIESRRPTELRQIKNRQGARKQKNSVYLLTEPRFMRAWTSECV